MSESYTKITVKRNCEAVLLVNIFYSDLEKGTKFKNKLKSLQNSIFNFLEEVF